RSISLSQFLIRDNTVSIGVQRVEIGSQVSIAHRPLGASIDIIGNRLGLIGRNQIGRIGRCDQTKGTCR
ncbi:hypothetical protein BpHYR1_019797, partial [Brachionus plicatilis]